MNEERGLLALSYVAMPSVSEECDLLRQLKPEGVLSHCLMKRDRKAVPAAAADD